MPSTMTVVVGHVGAGSVVESVKATGVVVPPIGPVVYASDNTTIATISADGTTWAAFAAGTANISALDQGNGLTDTVAVTVTPVVTVADLLTLTLS